MIKSVFFFLVITVSLHADQFNAKSIIENDDGSISIRQPVYEITNRGKSLPVSASASNLNGICKAFGLGRNITVIDDKSSMREFAVVNSKGGFEKSMNRKELKEYGNRRTEILEIVCLLDYSARLSKTSTRAKEIVRLDYGTVRIINPVYGMVAGAEHPFSGISNLNGVCRLYGYERVHSESAKITDSGKPSKKLAVTLSRDGRFSGFARENNSEDSGVIETITCQGELLYRVNANFHPQGLGKTLQGIAVAVKPLVSNYIALIVQNLLQVAPLEPGDSRMLKEPAVLSRSEWLRLLELELLSPIFDSLTSVWFETAVRPELTSQKNDLKAHYRYQHASELAKKDGALELLIYHVVASVDAMSKEVYSTEASKWLVLLKAKAGSLLAAMNKTKALKDFLAEWKQGQVLLTEIRSNRGLEGLVGSLELSAELLKELE